MGQDATGRFALGELIEIMRSCAGVDETVDLGGEITEMAFSELGYDSLAVLEVTGHIERTYDVTLPDEAVAEIATPGELVAYVNTRMTPELKGD